jgi:hypothetical protein
MKFREVNIASENQVFQKLKNKLFSVKTREGKFIIFEKLDCLSYTCNIK